MKSTQGKVVVSLVLASIVCLLAVDFAEARRGGGDGMRDHARLAAATTPPSVRNLVLPIGTIAPK